MFGLNKELGPKFVGSVQCQDVADFLDGFRLFHRKFHGRMMQGGAGGEARGSSPTAAHRMGLVHFLPFIRGGVS